MYTIDRGLFSKFNWGASFDDMFMKFYFLSCHHLKLDKSCNKLCMYQISQTYHQNSHPSFNIDNFRFCPQSSSTDCVVNKCTQNQQLIFLKQDGHVMDRRNVCILLYKIIFDN